MSLFFLQVQLYISRDIYILFSICKHFIKGHFSGLIIYLIVLHRKESYLPNQAPHRKRAPKRTLCSCLDVEPRALTVLIQTPSCLLATNLDLKGRNISRLVKEIGRALRCRRNIMKRLMNKCQNACEPNDLSRLFHRAKQERYKRMVDSTRRA